MNSKSESRLVKHVDIDGTIWDTDILLPVEKTEGDEESIVKLRFDILEKNKAVKCLLCDESLTVARGGSVRVDHFRHKPDSECILSNKYNNDKKGSIFVGETLRHARFKHEIAGILKTQGYTVHVEKTVHSLDADCYRRPDIFLPEINLAIEYQLSWNDALTISERQAFYRDNQYRLLWLVNEKCSDTTIKDLRWSHGGGFALFFDDDELLASKKSGELIVRADYQTSIFKNGLVVTEPFSSLVSLSLLDIDSIGVVKPKINIVTYGDLCSHIKKTKNDVLHSMRESYKKQKKESIRSFIKDIANELKSKNRLTLKQADSVVKTISYTDSLSFVIPDFYLYFVVDENVDKSLFLDF